MLRESLTNVKVMYNLKGKRGRMRYRVRFLLHFILILLLIISTTLTLRYANAQLGMLSVVFPNDSNESINEVGPGGTFTVRIDVSAEVADLAGFEFKLRYKTSVLNATQVRFGGLFPSGSLEFTRVIDDAVGYVWYAVVLAQGQDPRSGPGTVATVSFAVELEAGSSCVYLEDTKLSDSGGNPISHEVNDGYFAAIGSDAHDVAITHVKPFSEKVIHGQTVDITVVARNHGRYSESFTVDASANATPIGETAALDLDAGGGQTLTFTWDTSAAALGKYIISANASVVPDETDTSDNNIDKAYDYVGKTYIYITITIIDYPTATFYYSPATPLANDIITFNASESTPKGGEIENYRWDFGDGNTATSVSHMANHPYVSPGIYSVVLNVTDSEDLSDITSRLVTVYFPDLVAVTNVTVYPTSVTKPNPVFINVTVTNMGQSSQTFSVTAYYNSTPAANPQTVTNLDPAANTTLKFTWDTTYVPATTLGTSYQISAKAEELPCELNTTNNEFVDGNVIVYKPPGPNAQFTYLPTEPIEGDPVSFDASLSTPDPVTSAPITSYHWDFGDGTSDSGITATHTYAEAGSYTVKLNVTDNQGLWDAIEKILTVNEAVHDIAVTTVETSATEAVAGGLIFINVTIENQGNKAEIFDLKINASTVQIITQHSLTLSAEAKQAFTFTWNTTGANLGTYTIKAEVPPVPGEVDIADNIGIDSTVTVGTRDIIILTIAVNPTKVTIGQTVTINVTVRNDGTFAENRINVTTYYATTAIGTQSITSLAKSASKTLNFTWSTTEVNPGSYTISANASRARGETNVENNVKIFGQIELKLSSTTLLTVSPQTLIVGESTTLSGSINPARSGVTVHMWYRLQGEQTWKTLKNVTTDGNSQYSFTWVPPSAAIYEVKASWEGDQNTYSSESLTSTITVNEAPTGIPTYAIVAIAIVIIAAIGVAVYYLRTKRH